MDNECELDREWVEIVLVLEDCILIDFVYDLYVFDGCRLLGVGFYLVVYQGGQCNFGKVELVGLYEYCGMVEMLYDMVWYFGVVGEFGMVLCWFVFVLVLLVICQFLDCVLMLV